MQVRLRSGNYDIIANGETFLFGEPAELAIDIEDTGFNVHLLLKFLHDDSNEQKVEAEIIGDCLVWSCFNFDTMGTGLNQPVHIADVNGRKVFLTFWTYLEGKKTPKVRSVKYTLFYEK